MLVEELATNRVSMAGGGINPAGARVRADAVPSTHASNTRW